MIEGSIIKTNDAKKVLDLDQLAQVIKTVRDLGKMHRGTSVKFRELTLDKWGD